MAIAYKSVGTATATGSTSAIFDYPNGISAGDLIVLGVVNKYPPNAPSTLGGYTAITNGQGMGGAVAAGTDAGTVYATTFYKVAEGNETGKATVTVSSGNSSGANVTVYSRTSAQYDWVTPQAGNGADSTRGTSWSITAGSTMDIMANDMVVVFSGANADTQTYSAQSLAMGGISSWTAHNERADVAITGGNDCRLIFSTHVPAAGTATTAGTFTMTANGTLSAGASVIIRLREYWARGTVTPGDGFQAQAGDAPAVYAAYPVTFADGFQAQTGTEATVEFFEEGGGPVDVTPGDGFQAQAGDGAVVSTGYPVAGGDGFQTQAGDAAVVRATYTTTGGDGFQSQTGDAATVRAGYLVTFTDGFQSQAGDSATLNEVVGSISVSPGDGFQAQTGDTASANAGYNISPAKGNQSQVGDAPSVWAGYPIAPADGFQSQSGDIAQVYSGYYVQFADGFQSQYGDPAPVELMVTYAAQTPRMPVIKAGNERPITSGQGNSVKVYRRVITAEHKDNIEVK